MLLVVVLLLTIAQAHADWDTVPMYYGFSLDGDFTTVIADSLKDCRHYVNPEVVKAVSFRTDTHECRLFSTVYQATFFEELAKNKSETVVLIIKNDENGRVSCDKAASEKDLAKIVQCRKRWLEMKESDRVYCYILHSSSSTVGVALCNDRSGIHKFVSDICSTLGVSYASILKTASIHSSSELKFIQEKYERNLTTTKILVGILPSEQKEDDLKWVDGTPVGFNFRAFKKQIDVCQKKDCNVLTLGIDGDDVVVSAVDSNEEVNMVTLCQYEASRLVDYPAKKNAPEADQEEGPVNA